MTTTSNTMGQSPAFTVGLGVWCVLTTAAAALLAVDRPVEVGPRDDHVTVVQVTPDRNCARPLVPC